MVFTTSSILIPERKGYIDSQAMMTVANQFAELMAERCTTKDFLVYMKEQCKGNPELHKGVKAIIENFLNLKEESCFEKNWSVNGDCSVKKSLEKFISDE